MTKRNSGQSGQKTGRGREGSKNGGKSASRGPKAENYDLLELGPEEGDDLLELEGGAKQKATIKVVGVGGGGGNALNTMISSGISGVQFIAANTDSQALGHNQAPIKVQLGAEVTRGLGCGANPDRGRASALEARDRLREILEGSDMVFVTAGMGGGTGTGSAPIIAEVAREVGALTVGVVTKPFPFEGRVRMKHADRGIDQLHSVVDTLITIPNQRLLALAGKKTGIQDAFQLADDVLVNAVRGISDLITIHGMINLDFADVRTVMNESGVALMGTGVGLGDTRGTDAAQSAISSPLLEDLSIDGARGVLINITGGSDMTLHEVSEASMLVQEAAHEDANIIFGAVIDEQVPEGELRVTVIATGLDDGRAQRNIPETTTATTPPPLSAEQLEIENVTSFRPQAVEESGTPAPVTSATDRVRGPAEAPGALPQSGGAGAEFKSPFEDEYDTPAFIRRRAAEQEEEDRESPAFLRRASD